MYTIIDFWENNVRIYSNMAGQIMGAKMITFQDACIIIEDAKAAGKTVETEIIFSRNTGEHYIHTVINS